jgi:hypothetical protein
MTTAFKAAAAATLGALALIVTLTAPQSNAQQGGRGMAACRTDVATFCAGMEAGGGKRIQCLTANESKLQPACADAVRARLAERGARKAAAGDTAAAPTQPSAQGQVQGQAQAPLQSSPPSQAPFAAAPAQPVAGVKPMQVCRTDLQTLCANVEKGGGAKMRCLRDNQAKVSAPCADALAAKQSERKGLRANARGACKDDSRTFCAASKGPERRACLTANSDKLSPACAAAIKAN